jgi:hypothetical protein
MNNGSRELKPVSREPVRAFAALHGDSAEVKQSSGRRFCFVLIRRLLTVLHA